MSGTQGQSAITVDKERRIGAAMSVGMRIANAKFGDGRFRFWSFDANAGSGWNESVDVPGSPLVFWQVARACLTGLEPAPFFCDSNQTAMAKLDKRLGVDRSASVLIPYDNEEALDVFAECIRAREKPAFAVGAVIVDPNGYFYRAKDGSGAPVKALTWFCREFPRIDLILNMNMRTYQMQRAHGHDVLPPDEVLDSLNKKQWLVARTGGQSRFLLAIGRNTATGDHKALGLHDRTSEIGRGIVANAGESPQQRMAL